MARKFGMIATSIWSSRRFLSLPDEQTRLTYFYLHTNAHGNSIGAYRIPQAYFSADRGMDADSVAKAINAICEAGLAEYDHVENVVRITGWFTFNPITNRKHLMGAINAFNEIPSHSTIRPVVACEIAFSMLKRIKVWSKERKIHQAKQEVVEILSDFITEVRQSVGNKEFDEIFIGLSVGLCIALSIGLPIGLPIVRQIQETDKDTEIEKEIEIETDTGAAPKKSFQKDIDEMKSRAKKDAVIR